MKVIHKKAQEVGQRSRLVLYFALTPLLMTEGGLRVGARLRQAKLLNSLKHPVILPRKGHISDLIVAHFHEKTGQQGRGITIKAVLDDI